MAEIASKSAELFLSHSIVDSHGIPNAIADINSESSSVSAKDAEDNNIQQVTDSGHVLEGGTCNLKETSLSSHSTVDTYDITNSGDDEAGNDSYNINVADDMQQEAAG
jgi:hypothetical protein